MRFALVAYGGVVTALAAVGAAGATIPRDPVAPSALGSVDARTAIRFRNAADSPAGAGPSAAV